MGNIPKNIEEAFYEGNLSQGINYKINDSVFVLKGELSGESGAVISIESLEPEPTYLVELGNGGDVVIAQSNLKLLDS